MIDRRAVIVVLAGILFALSPGAHAQTAGKTAKIGWLGLDSSMQAGRLLAFQRGLRELGYVEGRNIHIEYRFAEGDFGRLPELAAELVALHVDVIVTASPPGVRAARLATSTIPIVMIVHEPVLMGFAETFARPGRNITGIAFQDTDLSTKRIDLFRQAVPGLSRVVLIWNGVEGTLEPSLRAIEHAAKSQGMQVLSLEVKVPSDFAAAIAKAKAWGAQGVVEMASPFITKNRKILLDLLRENRLPATCEMRLYVVDGCLMTYSASLDAMFHREAYYVDRILKGANPGDLAMEQPREFEFVINLKAARELGLTIPQLLLFQANEVIR